MSWPARDEESRPADEPNLAAATGGLVAKRVVEAGIGGHVGLHHSEHLRILAKRRTFLRDVDVDARVVEALVVMSG